MFKLIITRFLTVAAALATCACAGGVPSTSMQNVDTNAASMTSVPAACAGQSTTTQFATATGKFKPREGTLCIPAFKGFGGEISYPAAHPSMSVTVTSSTTNYNHQLPELGKGKAMFYIQIHTTAAVKFGKRTTTIGMLESKAIQAGKTYDVYGEAQFGGQAILTIMFPACAATAVAGKGGGEIPDLGNRMEGADIQTAGTIFLEVYPRGSQSPC